MNSTGQPSLVRAIGRWSLAALLVNSIIGSGIFGLPSIVAGLVGRASPLAYLIAAAGIGVIMACFAEVASQFSAAGGPYLYARAAFGRLIGIEMGWLSWLVRLTAGAAGANLFVIYLGEFFPHAQQPLVRAAVLTVLIGFIAAVNYRGVAGGTQMSNIFTAAKLTALALFIVAGLLAIAWRPPVVSALPAGTPGVGDWFQAVLLLVFAYGGFEAGLIPMSEAKNPRRDAPFALYLSLAMVTVVYTLIQIVVIQVLPNPAATQRPLADAAREFLGGAGAAFIAAAALVSVYGYLSAMMINSPRLTFALAEQDDFPALFGFVHPKFRTPYVSIVAFAFLVWVLALAGTFKWNVTLSAVARLFAYALVCAALPVLRRKDPTAQNYHLPGGWMFAGVGLGFSAALVSRMHRAELVILAATFAVALANWLWVRRRPQRNQGN